MHDIISIRKSLRENREILRAALNERRKLRAKLKLFDPEELRKEDTRGRLERFRPKQQLTLKMAANHCARWETAEELILLTKIEEGVTHEKIAFGLGRSLHSVKTKIRRLNGTHP